MDLVNDRYEEPQVYDLGDALTIFLGDEGEGEDSAKVLACTRCDEQI